MVIFVHSVDSALRTYRPVAGKTEIGEFFFRVVMTGVLQAMIKSLFGGRVWLIYNMS